MSSYPVRLSRREALRLGIGAGVSLALTGCAQAHGILTADALIQKPIPSTGERIPVIGIGTARRYDVEGSAEELAPLRTVLRQFVEMGGRLIDTAPSYGRAERVTGELVRELGIRDRVFLATKVSTRGDAGRAEAIEQMEESLRRFGTDRVDLMQIHNLSNLPVLLPLVREWKEAGRVRYVGVTTSSERQYEALVELMRREPLDFVQVNYSIQQREAADRILPLAADRRMAVLVNLPFGRTSVFQKVEGRELPGWAAEIDVTSWAQLFLKYIVSHPSVTAAIPGTATPAYLADNLAAARGRLPDPAMRRRIEAFYDAL